MLKRFLALSMAVTFAVPAHAAGPAAGVPTRVVVMVESVDAEDAAKFQSGRYEELFREAIEADPEALEVGGASTNRLAGETAAFMFFFSMGFGLIGGAQAMMQETEKVEALAGPVHGRFAEQRADQQLDRRFADAVGAALASQSALVVDGPVELVTSGPDGLPLEDDADAKRWVKENHAADPRGVLLVALRHGAPKDLSGVYGIAETWWFVPADALPAVRAPKRSSAEGRRADYLTHHADGTPRKTALDGAEGVESSRPVGKSPMVLARSHRHALFATPVPLTELKEPPASKVEAETAAIKAEFDPLIEQTKDRDLRRDLRGQRNRELAKATKWYPVSFAQHMHDAWLAPPGDAYARLMTRAQSDLARRIAEALGSGR